ncbi:MAG: B12-binding domain-containing radical SAM protein [Defluviitaleaceae bacterium]|nr:B12-binding domain-containing radical SAM protein [Defluviitaleaceae bacterium]MCL2275729.1 B12-binding domain-containing radical SAM protein [Defluviitaleaceae bacterium]
MAKNTKPLFIGLYDAKLLGIRYLSSTLRAQGYDTALVFLKTFNSYSVDEPTEAEYALLYEAIEKINPTYIGISVMCSFYLSVVKRIAADIRKRTGAKIILGGAYATLFPAECLAFADVVFRGESEEAIVDFTDALENGQPYAHLESLAVNTPDGAQINPLRAPIADINKLTAPDYGGNHMYYINNDRMFYGDPAVTGHSYELTTSRGCPNKCSYCSNATLRALYQGKGAFIRQRTVDDVIEEIKYARQQNAGIQMLRFWDEVFPWNKEWVTEFAHAYKKEVNLPFEVWGHPKLSNHVPSMKLLVDAGLSKIVIGVQSGDPTIRKEIYTRNETQEDILTCSRALAEAKIPMVIYDFILGHPFETEEDLRNTLDLCRALAHPFRLQLHGLSFLPGTPIEEIAVQRGVKTWDEIRTEQARPLREQYHSMAWWRQGHGGKGNEKIFWYTLIYLTQFPSGARIIRRALLDEGLKNNPKPLLRWHKIYNYYVKFQMGWRKLKFIIKSKTRRFT